MVARVTMNAQVRAKGVVIARAVVISFFVVIQNGNSFSVFVVVGGF